MSSQDPQSYRRRPVNAMLGSRPKIGPLPAELVIPWIGITLAIYFVAQGMFHLGWLWTGILIAWGCSTWWVLTGNRPWVFLSKFIGTPFWTRGFIHHRSFFDPLETAPKQDLRKRSQLRRKSSSPRP